MNEAMSIYDKSEANGSNNYVSGNRPTLSKVLEITEKAMEEEAFNEMINGQII